MSQSAITKAFETYLAAQVAEGQPVTLDQFIFANVPGLDPDAPINRVTEVVPVENVVYQQDVTLPGLINENEVVYSVTMGTDVGDFDFNWIGLVNKSTGLLGMVTHAPVQQKFKNADGQQGNTLTRSFLMEYDGAATATNITTPAETWQIDFTARLAGMDDRERLENTDIYGEGAFFGDAFLISGNPTNGYQITAGVGYVGGLRVSLSTTQAVAVDPRPTMIWVDACWKGTLTSVWQTVIGITSATSLENYVDATGLQHYVFAVASIDANGAITDLRPKGSQDGQRLKDYLRIDQSLAEIATTGATAQQAARDNLGLKSAATHDVTTSHSDTTAGHMLQVGDGGLLEAADMPMGTVSQFLAYSSADFDEVPLNGAGWQAAYAPTRRAQVIIDTSGKFHSRFTQSAVVLDADTPWAVHYTTLNKPTSADVGALPTTGGSMTGELNMDAVPQLTYKISALSSGDTGTTNCLRIFRGGSGDTIYHERVVGQQYYIATGNDASQVQMTLDTISGRLTLRGEIVPGDYGNLDARYYTQSAANAKFPTAFRIGSRTRYDGSDYASHVPQGAVNIYDLSDGDDRITGTTYAYPQFMLNGNWYNFS